MSNLASNSMSEQLWPRNEPAFRASPIRPLLVHPPRTLGSTVPSTWRRSPSPVFISSASFFILHSSRMPCVPQWSRTQARSTSTHCSSRIDFAAAASIMGVAFIVGPALLPRGSLRRTPRSQHPLLEVAAGFRSHHGSREGLDSASRCSGSLLCDHLRSASHYACTQLALSCLRAV